jgi:hypothetical protein
MIWAARKGSLEVVKALVQYNANPDAVGMVIYNIKKTKTIYFKSCPIFIF